MMYIGRFNCSFKICLSLTIIFILIFFRDYEFTFLYFFLYTFISIFIAASPSTSTSSKSSILYKNPCILNMKKGVWDKVPNTIVTICQRGEKLLPAQRQTINRIIAEYMINELQRTSRGAAEKIATDICETYPETFKDTIDNQQWGSGIESLRMQIYNCVQYMKHTHTSKNRNKRALSPDSDDVDEEKRRKEAAISRRQGEYGCVAPFDDISNFRKPYLQK